MLHRIAVYARSSSKQLSDASPLVYHAASGSLKDKENATVVQASLRRSRSSAR